MTKRDRDLQAWAELVLVACLVWLLVILATCHTRAKAAEPDALRLARVCWLEAATRARGRDCTAIHGVGRELSDDGWAARIEAFSQLAKRDHARGLRIRSLPYGPVDGWRHSDAWQDTLRHAERILAGRVPNPCAGATGWGGTLPGTEREQARIAANVAAGRWVIDCAPGLPGRETKNIFYHRASK